MRTGYTLDDKVAMATAFGCTYGAIQKHLEFGYPLPPQRRPVKWPKSSTHIGELQMDGTQPKQQQKRQPEPEKEVPQEAQEPAENLQTVFRAPKPSSACSACGKPLIRRNAVGAHLRRIPEKDSPKRPLRLLCPACTSEFVPGVDRGGQQRNYAPRDAEGNIIGTRFQAVCFRCGLLHNKKDGAQIYVKTVNLTSMHVGGYLCEDCAVIWDRETQKGAAE